jgi:hypothetical protein
VRKQAGATGTYCIDPADGIGANTTIPVVTGDDPARFDAPPVLHQIITAPYAACTTGEFVVVTLNLRDGGRVDRGFSFAIP